MSERNQFFAIAFSNELERWKKATGHTQAEFSEMTGIHPNSISRYKGGKAFPTEPALNAICRVLKVDESVFYPATIADRILYDEKYRTDVVKKSIEHDLEIVKAAGIRHGFWEFFLSNDLIRDIFPFEISPAEEYSGAIVFGGENHAGKKTGFTAKDLLYVRHLQDEVESIISAMLIRETMLREYRKEDQNEQKHDEDG